MLQAEHTLLDPISLALFEDTGWYIVNYTMAEELVWGKGKYNIISLSISCSVCICHGALIVLLYNFIIVADT